MLLASFVTAVDNSTAVNQQQSVFLQFLSILLWLNNNTENVLFYKVK